MKSSLPTFLFPSKDFSWVQTIPSPLPPVIKFRIGLYGFTRESTEPQRRLLASKHNVYAMVLPPSSPPPCLGLFFSSPPRTSPEFRQYFTSAQCHQIQQRIIWFHKGCKEPQKRLLVSKHNVYAMVWFPLLPRPSFLFPSEGLLLSSDNNSPQCSVIKFSKGLYGFTRDAKSHKED